MPLMVGLADFQFVHPTEMENYVAEEKNDLLQPVAVTRVRRKRVPVPGASVVVKAKNWYGKPNELEFHADDTGRMLCAASQMDAPQLPMDADYEIRLPNGHAERGKVRVGGNEHVRTTEIVSRFAS